MIILYPFQNAVYTVLTLRPSEFGIHSDQVSFPGGRFEEEDNDLQTTALRETREELGIDPSQLSVAGKLTTVYIPVSNFLVHPFVAVSPKRPQFFLNPYEVREIIETDIRIFSDDKIRGESMFGSGDKKNIEAPFYEVNKHKIWGATAMILSELENILQPLFGNG